MHISCPRCEKTINAKDYNLFGVWECPDCEWRFRGVHAGQPAVLNYVYRFIAPYYHGPHLDDISDCPHCGSIVDLDWIWEKAPGRSFGPFRRKGYNGPYVCRSCCRNLPWDYPEQKPHVLEAYQKWAYEHNKKYGFLTNEDKDKSPQENSQEKPRENKKSKEDSQQLEKQMQKRKEKERMSELANRWKEEKEESLKVKPFCKQKSAE